MWSFYAKELSHTKAQPARPSGFEGKLSCKRTRRLQFSSGTGTSNTSSDPRRLGSRCALIRLMTQIVLVLGRNARAIEGVHAGNDARLDTAVTCRRAGTPVGRGPVVLCGQVECCRAVHARRLACCIVLCVQLVYTLCDDKVPTDPYMLICNAQKNKLICAISSPSCWLPGVIACNLCS